MSPFRRIKLTFGASLLALTLLGLSPVPVTAHSIELEYVFITSIGNRSTCPAGPCTIAITIAGPQGAPHRPAETIIVTVPQVPSSSLVVNGTGAVDDWVTSRAGRR
jgi:hypothetical protein